MTKKLVSADVIELTGDLNKTSGSDFILGNGAVNVLIPYKFAAYLTCVKMTYDANEVYYAKGSFVGLPDDYVKFTTELQVEKFGQEMDETLFDNNKSNLAVYKVGYFESCAESTFDSTATYYLKLNNSYRYMNVTATTFERYKDRLFVFQEDGDFSNIKFPQQSGQVALSEMTATVEATTTASKAYVVNDLLIYNGVLYKVTSAISSGGTITPGTNVIATTIDALLNDNTSIDLVQNDIDVENANADEDVFALVNVDGDSITFTNDVIEVSGNDITINAYSTFGIDDKIYL